MAAKKKPAGKAAAWTRNRGKQPVGDDVVIVGRRRDKQFTAPLRAWQARWKPTGEHNDIMAWRRVRKPRQPKAEPIPHEAKALAAGLDVKPEKVAEDLAAAEPRSITGLSPLHVVLPPVPVPAPAAVLSEPEPKPPHEADDLFTRGQVIAAFVVGAMIIVGLLMYIRHTLPAVAAP